MAFCTKVILRGNDKHETPAIERPQVHPDLELIAQKKLLVIGDLVLDQYIWGDVNRISLEPSASGRSSKTFRLGGAANVACNIADLLDRLKLLVWLVLTKMVVNALYEEKSVLKLVLLELTTIDLQAQKPES